MNGNQDLTILLAKEIEVTLWIADSLVKCAFHRLLADAISEYFPLEAIEPER